ncbi:cold shock domain-containing protein [Streptomyces sp. NPDC057806]|uniref:cold shock domain-containing protein n=1 Tax=Streptomyces sp. NPDC057806 TaxID=3346255 RepID=UPI003690516F
MASGTVRWFDDDRGYGFISPDGGGPDVRFDCTEIQLDNRQILTGYKVEAGERVLFDFKFQAYTARAVKIFPLGKLAPPPMSAVRPSTRTPDVSSRGEWVGCWLTLLLMIGVVVGLVWWVRTAW